MLPWSHDGIAAGSIAAVVSGIPSTLHALATGRDPLEATLAAGSVLLPYETSRTRLFLAAGVVHASISLGWALLLARTLPRRHTALAGAAAGLAIAVVDLAVIGRRFPRIRKLPLGPQVADHLAYGATVGTVLARRGRTWATPSREG